MKLSWQGLETKQVLLTGVKAAQAFTEVAWHKRIDNESLKGSRFKAEIHAMC